MSHRGSGGGAWLERTQDELSALQAKSVASDTWGGGPDPAMTMQRVSGLGISPPPRARVPEHTGDEVGAARGL